MRASIQLSNLRRLGAVLIGGSTAIVLLLGAVGLSAQLESARSGAETARVAVLDVLALAGEAALVLVVSSILVRKTLKPLEQLIDSAERLALGESVGIEGVERADAIGRLARALVQWERSSRERFELAQTMGDLVGHVELNEVIDEAMSRLQRLLGAAEVVVTVNTSFGQTLRAIPSPFDLEWLPERSPGGQAIAHRRTVVADVREGDWDPAILAWTSELRLAYVLAVPLVSAGRVFGVVSTLRRADSDPFDEADVHRAEIIVATFAAAIHVASLFEELRRANAELEGASRSKSEFLANMSHELRTPLNAILGFSQLLLDRPGFYDEASTADFLRTISSAGRHLLELINDILDLSKVEAGRMELHPTPFNLNEAIEHVIATMKPAATGKNIALETKDDPPVTVVADQRRVRQILLNLISNAVKFTPSGGTVEVFIRPGSDEVTVGVADNGIGITESDQELIFDEFRQVERSAAGNVGTGLGLALTKRLVELHGGTLEVASKVGEGSTFLVTLPVATFEREGVSETETQGVAGPLVLVVEDDHHAAQLVRRHLREAGYRVRSTSDGRRALDLAKRLRPDAITLDILLPGLDGWEVLRALKQDPRSRDIPVVITSIIDDESLGVALGAADYLVKPLTREVLLTALGRLGLYSDALAKNPVVLAVDDDPRALDLLAGIMEPLGCRVLRAGGGREGIEVARRERPDAIFLDLVMPHVPGFEVVQELKRDPSTAGIPILILTAKDLTAAEKEILNGHAASVLRKGSLASFDLLTWLGRVRTVPAGR